MTDEDEYRFYPEDFDEDGELIVERDGATLAPLIIVGSLGAGIALFVSNFFLDPVHVAGIDIELRSLAALVFSVGLVTGSIVYLQQGERLLAAAHALGAFGWVFLAFGAIFERDVLLVAGAGGLAAGAAALIALVWRANA